MGAASKPILKMAVGGAVFSFLIYLFIIFHQEILKIFDRRITIDIGKHEFKVNENECKF